MEKVLCQIWGKLQDFIKVLPGGSH